MGLDLACEKCGETRESVNRWREQHELPPITNWEQYREAHARIHELFGGPIRRRGDGA